MPAQSSRPRRQVVSFVRRGARMTPSQEKAWAAHHDRYVVEVPRGEFDVSVADDAHLDLTATFGRDAPLIVEIGPGVGDSLVPMAKDRTDANVLAFEVYRPVIAALLIRLVAAGVDNVRIVQANAVEALERLVPDAGIDSLWLFFPDPWHKLRHHKRRLVSPEFADLMAAKLAPGGVWRIATDWADYANHIRRVLDAHPDFTNPHPDGWAPRFDARPLTRFEQRGLEAGRAVFDLTYLRR